MLHSDVLELIKTNEEVDESIKDLYRLGSFKGVMVL